MRDNSSDATSPASSDKASPLEELANDVLHFQIDVKATGEMNAICPVLQSVNRGLLDIFETQLSLFSLFFLGGRAGGKVLASRSATMKTVHLFTMGSMQCMTSLLIADL